MTPTQITQTEVDKVLEYFVDKTLSPGLKTSTGTISSYVEFHYKDSPVIHKFCTILEDVSSEDAYNKARIEKVIGLETRNEEFSTLQFNEKEFQQRIGKRIGHPILIGDVLEKVKKDNFDGGIYKPEFIYECEAVLKLWSPCGFSKSLQQIASEAEWVDMDVYGNCHKKIMYKKSPARELFAFLYSLIPTK